jgi:hypothetical protein
MPIELLLVSVLRTLVEVAMLSLLGQGVVGLLAGAARTSNPIYRLFSIVTRPPVRGMRFLMPRLIADKHIPFVTFFVLFWLWIVLAYVKRSLCQANSLVC